MFSDPSHIIAQFDLQSGSHVADLGAGSGAYTLALAKAVGEAGRVYAIDVQKGLLDRIKTLAREKGFSNVEAIWGDAERFEGTHLASHTVDAAFCSNILFQIEDKVGFVEEIARILKKGGKLLLVDWKAPSLGKGPSSPMAQFMKSGKPAPQKQAPAGGIGPRHGHVSLASARTLFEQQGFRFHKSVSVGAHHYGMVFKKST